MRRPARAAHVVWLALAPLLMVGTLAQSPAGGDAEMLFEAARTGDRARVVSLLNGGVDVNTKSRYGVTAAGFAADKGHLEVVRLLVERGANLDVTDSFYGSRPIDFALRGGHPDVALYLLSRGSKGAAGALMAGIRSSNQALVEGALATNEPDGVALAAASALAERQGTPAIAELVKKAASAKPAASLPPAIAVPASALPALEGRYLSAASGAAVTVAASGERSPLPRRARPPWCSSRSRSGDGAPSMPLRRSLPSRAGAALSSD